MITKFPNFNQALSEDPTTRRIWYGIGTVHDLETHNELYEEKVYQKIFLSHFGHLAILFLWAAGNFFHIAWQGNYQAWIINPLNIKPIAHSIWDPHFGEGALKAFVRKNTAIPTNLSFSGLYQWSYTVGIRENKDLMLVCLALGLVSFFFIQAGFFHSQKNFQPKIDWFKKNESRLNHHLSGLFGLTSLAWAGHLIHVAIPQSRGIHIRWNNVFQILPHPSGLSSFFSGNLSNYAENPDLKSHIFDTSTGAGTAILTFKGGFHFQTQSLWLTDIAHHHLAIGIFFILAGHMYRTNFAIGHSIKEILEAHRPPEERLGNGHAGLYETITDSLHIQLGLALASLGVTASLAAQHIYALNPYAFLSKDYTTEVALYTHHQYIAGFLMIGAFAHGAIFFVRDYNPEINSNNVLSKILDHKEAIISHLSWVSLFLGFHTLGLYVHNDVVVAFAQPEKQILIEPIFAQWIQSASGKAYYGLNHFLSFSENFFSALNISSTVVEKLWLENWIESINNKNGSLFLLIGPGDFLVHHAIALGLHTTTLILIKGALDARGSKLMPDKKEFGYTFPCDGPGRGGTCDISAWDTFYLAMFWMLNTIGWTTFYWHWKHISLWLGNSSQFDESSNYIMGWLRDYLWLNSSPLINGYNSLGINNLSTWAWMFLFGHLIWATGFMFLISWRGYWQELIETIIWAHERTPLANLIKWKDKPVALSIVQARLIGLVHFTVGYILTYAPFIIASTLGKFNA